MTPALRALVLGVLAAGCSQQKPLLGLPPMGKTMLVKPLVMNHSGPAKAAVPAPSAVHLTLMWGGKPIDAGDADPTVSFYTADAPETAAYTKKWADFVAGGAACPEDLRELTKEMRGAALVCDPAFMLNSYVKIAATNTKNETRMATSFSTFLLREDGVLGVSAQLF